MAKILRYYNFREGSIVDKITGNKPAVISGTPNIYKGETLLYKGASLDIGEVVLTYGQEYTIIFATNAPKDQVSHIIGSSLTSGYSFVRFFNNDDIYVESDTNNDGPIFNNTLSTGLKHYVIKFHGSYAEMLANLENLSTVSANTYSNNFTFNIIHGALTTTVASYAKTAYIKIYEGLLTQEEIEADYKDFLQSQITTPPIKDFDYSALKPTDLSHLVDGKLVLTSENSDFDNSIIEWWQSTQAANVYIEDGLFKFRNCTNGQGFKMPNGAVSIGDKLLIVFKISNHVAGGLRFYNNAEYISDHYSSNGTYVFEMISISILGFYLFGNATTCDIEYMYVYTKKGLLAAYNMIPSGDKLIDISGQGNDGTIYGAVRSESGLRFDKTGDVVSIDSLLLPLELTILFRLKTFGTSSYLMSSVSTTTQSISKPDDDLLYFCGTSIDIQPSPVNLEYTLIIRRDSSGDIKVYTNGIDVTIGTFNNTTIPDIQRLFAQKSSNPERVMNGVCYDLRILNYAITPQEALAYHNSFNETTLNLDFSKHPVLRLPDMVEQVSGEAYVDEEVVEVTDDTVVGYGDDETNNLKYGVFIDSNSDGLADQLYSFSDSMYEITLYNGLSVQKVFNTSGVNRIIKVATNTPNQLYRIRIDYICFECDQMRLVVNAGNIIIPRTDGEHSLDFTKIQYNNGNTFYFGYATTGYFYIKNITLEKAITVSDKLTELGLPQPYNYNRYLENKTAGVTAIQQPYAYGEWRGKFNKAVFNNSERINLMSPTLLPTGYGLFFSSSKRIYIPGGGFTDADFLIIGKSYEFIVQRLQSEGVFPMIPTLQTSDLVNEDVYPFDEFTSHGSTGFIAKKTVLAGAQYAGTFDEISFESGVKYLVEFNLELYSGDLPRLTFNTQLWGSLLSTTYYPASGYNSIVMVATGTNVGVLQFSVLSSYLSYFKISGLTIRKIYPANTFAVFTKAEDEADFSLVPVVSGSNPVTDGTHTESKYLSMDLDAGDRVEYIKHKTQF